MERNRSSSPAGMMVATSAFANEMKRMGSGGLQQLKRIGSSGMDSIKSSVISLKSSASKIMQDMEEQMMGPEDDSYDDFNDEEDEVERRRGPSLPPRSQQPDVKYRGFSTPFAQSFRTPESQTLDTCGLVCCGILQKDRNNYLLNRTPPSSCWKRVWVGFVIPFVLLSIAYYAHYFTPFPPYHDWVALAMILVLIVYTMVQAVKNYHKRMAFRKELLWRKYCRDGVVVPHPAELDAGNNEYLMGQTESDIEQAHFLCGCYRDDILSGTKAEEEEMLMPLDLCGCLWRIYTNFCCGLCHYYWQCCGMCAISQEARDLEDLIPTHRRMLDYITMQPVLQYYQKILLLRQHANYNFRDHWNSISTLSTQLVTGAVLVVLLSTIVCVVLRFPLYHIGILLGAFAYTLGMLWFVHWPYNKHKISLDLVIKAFASGFCLATTMALTVEVAEGLAFKLVVEAILRGNNFLGRHFHIGNRNDVTYNDVDDYAGEDRSNYVANYDDDQYYENLYSQNDDIVDNANYSEYGDDAVVNDGYNMKYVGASLWWQMDASQRLTGKLGWLYIVLLFIHAFLVSALVEETCKYLVFRMSAFHPDYWSMEELEKTVKNTKKDQTFMDSETVNAAHSMVVHAHEKQRSLKSRCTTVMVTTMAIALGFGCCETLLYVFFYSDNSASVEMGVLLARAFVPIHPICALWQAINVCRHDVENEQHFQMGRILLPVILFHGLFDFLLLVVDYFEAPALELQTLAVTVCMTIIGGISVLYQYREQQRRLGRKTWIDMASKD